MSESTENLRTRTFSERLQQALQDAGMSQQALSERTFIAPSTITRWFTEGSVPQPRTVEAVANAIGVRKEWLLAGEEPMRSVPSSRVRETPPSYDLVKKAIYIQEEATPEQLDLLNLFLDAVCAKLGFPRRRKKDASPAPSPRRGAGDDMRMGGDTLVLYEEIKEEDQAGDGLDTKRR